MSRALILSCSRSKRPSNGRLPALERYDGPAFRVLRRYLRQSNAVPPVVRIISAEFGLIKPEDHIGNYDRRMTTGRAKELRSTVAAAFEIFYRSSGMKELMVFASDVYIEALAGCWFILDGDVVVHVPKGGIGCRTSRLHEWLYGTPPLQRPVVVSGRVEFKGAEIAATVDQVLEVARAGLLNDCVKASRFESWCVPVDRRAVAPKWLVSKLSGVPVDAFRSSDALTVLRKLGVTVKRVPPSGFQTVMKGAI